MCKDGLRDTWSGQGNSIYLYSSFPEIVRNYFLTKDIHYDSFKFL